CAAYLPVRQTEIVARNAVGHDGDVAGNAGGGQRGQGIKFHPESPSRIWGGAKQGSQHAAVRRFTVRPAGWEWSGRLCPRAVTPLYSLGRASLSARGPVCLLS